MSIIKRAWGIRHIRAFVLSWRLASWWERQGRYMGAVINPSDIDYIQAVRRGDA